MRHLRETAVKNFTIWDGGGSLLSKLDAYDAKVAGNPNWISFASRPWCQTWSEVLDMFLCDFREELIRTVRQGPVDQ